MGEDADAALDGDVPSELGSVMALEVAGVGATKIDVVVDGTTGMTTVTSVVDAPKPAPSVFDYNISGEENSLLGDSAMTEFALD